MKRLLFILVLLVIGVTSCKKNKGPKDVQSAQPDNGIDSILTMKALINGVDWSTDSAYSYKVKNSGNDTGIINLMVIATQNRNDTVSTITFTITGYEGVKEYIINPPTNTATYYSGNQRHYATSGSFDVKSDSGNILSGTFNFVADTIAATKGTFKVALP